VKESFKYLLEKIMMYLLGISMEIFQINVLLYYSIKILLNMKLINTGINLILNIYKKFLKKKEGINKLYSKWKQKIMEIDYYAKYCSYLIGWQRLRVLGFVCRNFIYS
jgi:hypothetical protein